VHYGDPVLLCAAQQDNAPPDAQRRRNQRILSYSHRTPGVVPVQKFLRLGGPSPPLVPTKKKSLLRAWKNGVSGPGWRLFCKIFDSGPTVAFASCSLPSACSRAASARTGFFVGFRAVSSNGLVFASFGGPARATGTHLAAVVNGLSISPGGARRKVSLSGLTSSLPLFLLVLRLLFSTGSMSACVCRRFRVSAALRLPRP
jgi:hypothetical protein